jgi:hypothetical protein
MTTTAAARSRSADSQDGPSSRRRLARTTGLWVIAVAAAVTIGAVVVRRYPLSFKPSSSSSAVAQSSASVSTRRAQCSLQGVGSRCRRNGQCCSQNCVGFGFSRFCLPPVSNELEELDPPVPTQTPPVVNPTPNPPVTNPTPNPPTVVDASTCSLPLKAEGGRCRRNGQCCSQNCVGGGFSRFCQPSVSTAVSPNPPATRPIPTTASPPSPTVIVSNPDATLPFSATFDTNTDGFTFRASVFRSNRNPRLAAGVLQTNGVLQVNLGSTSTSTSGNPNGDVSGGFLRSFVLDQDAAVTVEFLFRIKTSSAAGSSDIAQAMASIDGVLLGQAPFDVVGQVVGDADSVWKRFRVSTAILSAGSHTLTLGGYCSTTDSPTIIRFDNVQLTVVTTNGTPVVDPKVDAHAVVDRLDLQQFTNNIEILAGFGDRLQGSASYTRAASWVETELQAVGYTVQRDAYLFQGQDRDSLYVTKVGKTFPDRMFIVSAHLDGRGGGGAADDDGSGCSLVLEIARILAASDVEADVSVRMVFWNNEESGLNGSRAYASDRRQLQGQESPAGSGRFPEPTWLGVVQHDMILYDHGLPPSGQQIPGADADIEYRSESVFADQSRLLANALFLGNKEYGEFYPAQVGSRMSSTDSVSFMDVSPSVSLRENQRLAEIGSGSQPNWHQRTDLFSTYSDADFLFGFNIVQTTVGTVAELSGLKLKPVS